MVVEVSVTQLRDRRAAGTAPVILDVRDGWELDIAALPNVLHIPMNEISQRLSELDPAAETLVMCRLGGRSMKIAEYLAAHGFSRVANLTGGILAWSAEIDPSVKQY